MTIRRVNFYAGPGTGKSTTACDVFAKLKNKVIHEKLDIQVELVQEYVKSWAWEGRKPKGFDQVYICAQQMRREEIPLRNGVNLIVTDSPLLMQCAYAAKYTHTYSEDIVNIVNEFEKQYPSCNIFLERGNRPYIAKGRYETLEQARQMDKYILDFVKAKSLSPIYAFKYFEIDQIVDSIFDKINIV